MIFLVPAEHSSAAALLLTAGFALGRHNHRPTDGEGEFAPVSVQALNWFPESRHGGVYHSLRRRNLAERGLAVRSNPEAPKRRFASGASCASAAARFASPQCRWTLVLVARSRCRHRRRARGRAGSPLAACSVRGRQRRGIVSRTSAVMDVAVCQPGAGVPGRS